MDIQVRSNGVAVNDQLTTFIDRRAARLDHLVDHLVEAKLELRGVHNRVGPDITIAQITIRSGRDGFGQKSAHRITASHQSGFRQTGAAGSSRP